MCSIRRDHVALKFKWFRVKKMSLRLPLDIGALYRISFEIGEINLRKKWKFKIASFINSFTGCYNFSFLLIASRFPV